MKTLLIITTLLLCNIITNAADNSIGTILNMKGVKVNVTDILVEYEYNGKETLILTLSNVSMNAAAKGIKGATIITGDNIIIKPVEIYDSRGPADSYRGFSVQYIIKNVDPGVYTFTHDDTDTEGIDHILKIELNLLKARTSKTTVSFKETFSEEYPFGNPNDKDSKLRHKAPNLKPIKLWLDGFVGKDKEYITEYFGKKNVKPSNWKSNGKNELALTTIYKKLEVEFLFSNDKVSTYFIDFP